MATFAETLEQLEAQLEELGEKLEALVDRSEEISPRDKVNYCRWVATVQAKHRLMSKKLKALEEVGCDESDRDISGGWNALESAFFKIN